MKERSGMPYDVVAFSTDELAMQLSDAQEGIFHRLMRHAWLHGSIPADLGALALIARVPAERLSELWVFPLNKMWTIKKRDDGLDDRLINKKLESERKFKLASNDKQSERAKNGWKTRKEKELDKNAAALPEACRDEGECIDPAMPSPPLPSPSYVPSEHIRIEFDRFWSAYPKKLAKDAARRAWKKRKDRPPIDAIIAAIETAKTSHAWTKDGGQFIPNPATWLNQGRWADEHTTAKTQRGLVY